MPRSKHDEQGDARSAPYGWRPSRRTALTRAGQVLLAGSAGSLSTLLTACGTDGAPAPRATAVRAGGVLSAGVASDPDTLDPQKSSLAIAAEVYGGVFDRLLDLRPDGRFVPSLATSWSSPDERTHIFDIRPDVVFHNGDPLTAGDIAFTFERITSEAFGATYAADFSAVSGVEVTGPHQVTFHLNRPFAPLLANLANRGHILSRRAVRSKDPSRHPVGTGPFAFRTWKQGEGISLERNRGYFAARRPYLDAVDFSYLAVDESRILALRAGRLDWVDGVPPQSVREVRSDDALTYVSGSVAGKPQFLFFNTTRPPLDNKALRQAICWAIDRREIAKVGFFGAVEAGSQEFGRDSFWYSDDTDPYAGAPDPARVRAKLAEAGLPDGGVSIGFAAWTSAPDATRTAQLIRQQLKPFGIHIEIETLDLSVWVNRLFTKDYQMTLAFQEQIIDPDNFWSLIWTSTASQNVTGYRNTTVDALVAKAAASTDRDARKEIYGQIRRTVLDDAPTLFTVYTPLCYATKGSILGARISPTQDPGLVNVGFG
ncbi:MAG: ABC transporter substrate-binding protein [Actinoallomurus sp.]